MSDKNWEEKPGSEDSRVTLVIQTSAEPYEVEVDKTATDEEKQAVVDQVARTHGTPYVG